MISRRNIRIKVMQSLYAAESGDNREKMSMDQMKKSAAILLDEEIHEAADIFALCLLYIIKIAEYSFVDARIRGNKFLPTEADRHVSTKIGANSYVLKLKENEGFQKLVEKDGLEGKIEEVLVQKAYEHLVATEEYKHYIASEERENAEESAIIRYIWEVEMLTNESFENYLSEDVDGWDDDAEMINMLMDNFLHRNKKINFNEFISKEKNEFAHLLLRTVLEKDEFLTELIKPKLRNWEAERIPLIDMICLKMGISEFLYFPSIPTKVTINEYIEISKQYSTRQSSQFVNGVLDRLLKELQAENKIRKIAQ